MSFAAPVVHEEVIMLTTIDPELRKNDIDCQETVARLLLGYILPDILHVAAAWHAGYLGTCSVYGRVVIVICN